MKQIVLGGLSGSGKTTVLDLLLAIGAVRRGVTCTTRRPREGEVDGVHYRFVTQEWYDEAAERGWLADSDTYKASATASCARPSARRSTPKCLQRGYSPRKA
jgi:guanylate kinase